MKLSGGYGISDGMPGLVQTSGIFVFTGRRKMNVCGDWFRKARTV